MTYPSREFDDAVASVLAGRATEEQVRTLGKLLRSEAAARTAYLWQTELHGRLLTRDEVVQHAAPFRELATQPTRGFSSRGAWLALAATVALLATLAWVFLAEKAPVRVMAEILETTGGNRFHAGQRADLTELKFLKGTLRLRLDSGVTLDCDAPMDARFETAERLHLHRGRMNVDAGAHGAGFTVVTAEGDVVDLGTTFGIEAAADGAVKVAVFSGEVEMRPKQAASAHLKQGDAAKLKRSAAPERVQSVQLAQVNGTARLDSFTPPQPLVRAVSDNLGAGTKRFYGIVPGGMRADVTAFGDRPAPKWKAERGHPFPAELEGADLVQTFQDLRWGQNLIVRLSVARPAVVYVLQDPRNPPPAWLVRDFIKTDLHLRSGSWTAANITAGLTPERNGRFHIACEVWKREVQTPGTLEFGPPYEGAPAIPGAMYGLAVKALP
jgi:hypothetical protein